MLYKRFKDKDISWLGMGAMRLPTTEPRGPIDEVKARELLEYAYKNGINYYDTAYRYHGGASETFVTSVLSQYPRNSYYIATKMPGHMMTYANGKIKGIGYLTNETINSVEQIFEDQIKRCGVDYFDFYMLHNVCETAWDFYTNEELALVKYLQEQKKAGRIRHLGISAHGRPDTIDKFLTLYDCFEFAQIQINYLDWVLQDADKKYDVITKHGLAVIAMESIRGGTLASLNSEAEAMLKAARPNDSIAAWAFRFLQSLPNLPVVLSGMTTMEQLVENIGFFSKNDPTTEEENQLLRRVVDILTDLVPCTACAYCAEGCPKNLDIPKLISMGNEMRFNQQIFTMQFTLGAMSDDEMPSACIACGKCNTLCPQELDIPVVLKQFADALAESN